jgi:hypothetical protein
MLPPAPAPVAAEPASQGFGPFKNAAGESYVKSTPLNSDRLSPSAKSMLAGLESGGFRDLRVISGYRDPEKNAAVGGARGSQHIAGNAVDVDVSGMSDAQKSQLLEAAVASGARGVGLYPSGRSLHLDTRESPATWGPGADRYAGVSVDAQPEWARPALSKMFGAKPFAPPAGQDEQNPAMAGMDPRMLARAAAGGSPAARMVMSQIIANGNRDPNQRTKTALEIEKLRSDIDNSRLTGDQKDYDRAVKQGYSGTFLDYQKLMNESRRSSVNIDQRGENAFEKGTAEAQAKMYSRMAEDAINAKSDLGQIQVLSSQLATLPGGFVGAAQALASSFNVKLGDNISNVEAAESIISKLVPKQREPGSGSTSDADLKGFIASLPRLSNTPEGNALIVDTMESLANYRLEQGQIATAVITGQMNRADGMKALQALPNPLQNFLDSEKGAKGVAPKGDKPAADVSKMSNEELLKILGGQ